MRSSRPVASIGWPSASAHRRANSWRRVLILDEAAGEGDVGQDLVQPGPHRVVHQARVGDVFAALGGVRKAPAHLRRPTSVHQVDDELHLVQALEVGDLGLVPGLGQEPFDARRGTPRAPATGQQALRALKVGHDRSSRATASRAAQRR
ncbi:hypothetical protein RM423_22615 [Jatrophihabitans sp. DSM 44399]|uniref:Uncharacterized protein n=1 Tax=Jatrophihabitans lederbergiae TaxID=3075547 RepID=A0ABU2JGQ0_9ACTN|nr:hypothetical protein [Jatrophihabitans sp. DSM 44399]